jgi:hypothetical protein
LVGAVRHACGRGIFRGDTASADAVGEDAAPGVLGATGGAVGFPAGWCNISGRRERGVVHLKEGELSKNDRDGDSRRTNLHAPSSPTGYGRVTGARHVALRDGGRGDI